ncbi:MAG: MATE family efflux transporter [Clostridia bacterium]|nr:MATE family efflux transporter [Clostridia bacterium]
MEHKIEFSNQELKKLIFPLIIEQALAVMVGIADTMMVSSVGEAAISGVTLVDMISILLINLFAALATGGAVVTSQFIGARQRDKACLSANQLLLITLVISVGIMLFSIALRGQILRLMFGNIDSNVMENAMTYFWITALSYPFLAVYNSCAALFRTMGDSRVSMFAAFVTNIINIAGNAICVYVLHMGVAGVAVPTLIARAAGAIILLILIRDPHRKVYIRLKGFLPDISIIKKILFIGIPSGLENSMFQLGKVLVVSIIAYFGTTQIAANAVANNLNSMGCLPGSAISLAMITVVGQCIGAQDFDQAKYYAKKLLKLSYLLTIGMNLLVMIFLPLILPIYNLSDETLKLASILILIHCICSLFFWPASFVLPNALRAANDVKFTMTVSIISMWIFRVIFSYILGMYLGWGAIGVWIAMIMDWICRLSFFIHRFRSDKWRTKYIS